MVVFGHPPEIVHGSQDSDHMCRREHGGAVPASTAHHKALPEQALHLAATHPHLRQAPITRHADHSFL